MNKKTLFGIIIVLVTIGAFLFAKSKDKHKSILYGNVDIRQVNLGFRIAGKLKEMKADEGDIIKKGDLLAILDDEVYVNQLNQAKAQLAQAEVTYDNANLLYNRNLELCQRKLIAKQECDNLSLKKKAAKANLDFAKAGLDQANTTLNDSRLIAPSNGVVLTKIQEIGAIIGSGTPVYTLSLNESMWVRTYIQETQLGKIKLGDKVTILTDSTDKTYKGKIGFISPVAEFTPKNIETSSLRTDLVYRLRIVVEDADDYLKQGMPVTVKLK